MNFYDTMKKKANEQTAKDLAAIYSMASTIERKNPKDIARLGGRVGALESVNKQDLNRTTQLANTILGENATKMDRDSKTNFFQRDPSAGVVKANSLSNAELGRAIKRAAYEGLEVKGKPKVNQDFDANMTGVIEALHGKKPAETPVKKEESLVSIEVATKILKNAGYNDTQVKALMEIICK